MPSGPENATDCPICGTTEATVETALTNDTRLVRCRRCKIYRITEEALIKITDTLPIHDRLRLGAAIRELGERTMDTQLVTSDSIDSFLASAPRSFEIPSKVHKLLSAIARRSKDPGMWIQFDVFFDSPLAYANGREEFRYLVDYSADASWLERIYEEKDRRVRCRLTPNGWEQVQHRPQFQSNQGFVAMWFDDRTKEVYSLGILPAIEDDCHYRCRRIDSKEFNGDIIDEIVAEIRESRFVIADVTGHRNGVYFEAGFAMGLGIPVIWTCLAADANSTHFDAEHFNQIRWMSPGELRKRLANRIRATIGLGLFDLPSQSLMADQ